MDTQSVISALKTTYTNATNLVGGQGLILADAAKLLEDCTGYLKPGQTPAQALEQMHGDMDALMGLLAKEKRKNAGQAQL